MNSFDLIVIGSGAGLIVAEQAAAQGMQVAVIESGPLGGTCLNRGCIPSKMLIRSADVMELARRAGTWGIKLRVEGVDWRHIIRRVTESVESDRRELGQRLKDANITLIPKRVRFVGQKVLEAESDRFTAERIVIAAGSRPRLPELPGLDSVPYLTSDTALCLENQPRSLIIVGGGDIAAELAHFFSSLGTKVTLVNRDKQLLSKEDTEIAACFTKVGERKFNVIHEASVSGVSYEDGTVRVGLERQGEESCVLGEALLLATGRVPNTDGLNALATGVLLDDKGFIRANQYLETDVPGIWTLGDIVGRFMLRHSSNLEAEHVAHNVLHPDDQQVVDYHAMPHAVFASPQIGSVGMTENKAKERGRRYAVGRADYFATAYGESVDERDGFVKVLADADSREILGCHVVGPDAAVLVQEVANAMRQHQTTEAILRSIYIHPAAQEVVKDAFAGIAWASS